MSRLSNLKKVPFEIAQLLANDETIKRLLFNDDKDALEHETTAHSISLQQLMEDKYISFYPLTETGIKNMTRNTFIIINAEDFSLRDRDDNVSLRGSIYLSTDEDHYLLSNNRLRILELADTITNILNNSKLTSAGMLSLTGIYYVIYSDFRIGYKISFEVHDQQTRKAEL